MEGEQLRGQPTVGYCLLVLDNVCVITGPKMVTHSYLLRAVFLVIVPHPLVGSHWHSPFRQDFSCQVLLNVWLLQPCSCSCPIQGQPHPRCPLRASRPAHPTDIMWQEPVFSLGTVTISAGWMHMVKATGLPYVHTCQNSGMQRGKHTHTHTLPGQLEGDVGSDTGV